MTYINTLKELTGESLPIDHLLTKLERTIPGNNNKINHKWD